MKNSDTSICSSNLETETSLGSSRKLSRMAASSESSSSSRRARRRRTHVSKMMISREEEESAEKDEIEKKILALKKIVPGGETLAVENLFEETADYILSLRHKVEALRFVVAFVESSENNQRKKLGG